MKKIYKSPSTRSIELDMNQLIAQSIAAYSDEDVKIDDEGNIQSLSREVSSSSLWDNEW